MILLFWHPQCGCCQRILPELQAWAESRQHGPRQVVLISNGGVEQNREMALDFPILLDDGFKTGPQYGATGTPSAIAVDAAGLIASPLAVGGPAVIDLVMHEGRRAAVTAA